MTEISLVFPHQLFEEHPAINGLRPVALIEDELFFRQFKFNKKKLVLHRASMKSYEAALKSRGIQVRYFSAVEFATLGAVIKSLAEAGFVKFHLAEPEDYLLARRLNRFSFQHGIRIEYYPSPSFICTIDYLSAYFADRKRYFLTEFYIEQRKRLHVLLNTDGTPAGGKWTFDSENRRKLPKSVYVPPQPPIKPSAFVHEAIAYVEKHFPDHYGLVDHFAYAVNRMDAMSALSSFLEERLVHYGAYQDAIIENDSFLFHSVLTPALNIGLITPAEVIDKTLECAHQRRIPINSLEGFIRQILGWREFVRALYIREGVQQRTSNHWGHHLPIPHSFWTASTGIPPVDNIIRKVLTTAYSNHIERLMIIGNFMLLCGFHPDHIYRWFMELYIDAYDWVMVPNVYGMSQFADGGLMSTKPYISGSNYVLKMSDFAKGPWCDVWDGLYWHFIEAHRDTFSMNPRMSMMVRQLNKMDHERRCRLQAARDKFMAGSNLPVSF